METTISEVIKVNGRRVHKVLPHSTLRDALELMAKNSIGAVLVVDISGSLVGVFSERDFARKSIEREDLSMETVIQKLMTSEVITVRPEQTVQQCMEFVTRLRIRHLPVVDDSGLIGMVSIGDLVKAAMAEKEALLAEKQGLIGQLEGYISGSMA